MRSTLSTATVAALAATIAIAAPSTHAAPPNSGPTITDIATGTIAIDEQEDNTPTVTVNGASKTNPITIHWGDGRTSTRRANNCTRNQAIDWPKLCTITASTAYSAPGTYQITVTTKRSTLGTSTVTISPTASQTATITPTSIRFDQQASTPATVTATGITANTPITINWGNGISTPHGTTCTGTQAAQTPAACTITANMVYWMPGNYTITVSSSTGAVIASSTITVSFPTSNTPATPVRPPAPAPAKATAWRAPAGWVQPAGWSVVGGGATYLPCSTIAWHWEDAGRPETASLLKSTTIEALARMSAVTGLKFVETSSRQNAGLTFDWRWPAGNENNAALGGGWWNTGRAAINFNPDAPILQDQAAGFSSKFTWYYGDKSYSSEANGLTVMHEIGHALGLGHVNDPMQLMDTKSRVTDRPSALGQGDLDGLRTMYTPSICRR